VVVIIIMLLVAVLLSLLVLLLVLLLPLPPPDLACVHVSSGIRDRELAQSAQVTPLTGSSTPAAPRASP
jgi:hypothetical protein